MAVTPDYSEVAKLGDIWLHPKQGTDAAVAMAMGHVILKEFYVDAQRSAYFDDYVRRYTDLPMLVMLRSTRCRTATRHGARPLPARLGFRRQARPGQQPRMEDRGLRREPARWCCRKARSAFAGARRAAPTKASGTSKQRKRVTAVTCGSSCRCSMAAERRDAPGGFPVFRRHRSSEHFPNNVQSGRAGAHRARAAHRAGHRRSARRWWRRCSTCRCANYGVDRGLGELAATTSTTTRPTRRPGRSASPACRARR